MDQKQTWQLENFGLLSSNHSELLNAERDWFNSNAILFLFICYAVVIFGGVFGNATLVYSICTQPSGRLRKPLLFALCLADLLVVCVSAPLTIVILSLAYGSWPLQSIGCKAIYYLRSLPVAASTICLLMLSLDRYATVRHPRLGQLHQRRYLPLLLAITAWVGACVVCIPIFIAHDTTVIGRNDTLSRLVTSVTKHLNVRQRAPPSTGSSLQHLSKLRHQHQTLSSSAFVICKADYGSSEVHSAFVLLHAFFVFIVPAIGILINHLGVRQKLTALSLTARAAHGELPLPMPILRRPTHMIIVTGLANAARAAESSEDDGDGTNSRRNDDGKVSARLKQLPRTPRSIRRAQNQENQSEKPSSDLPLPQTSTLRSRRRLGNILVASALIFACFWAPHVFCYLCIELGASCKCSKPVAEFSLLLGHAHSAISPILYWTLNHNTLRQACCSPCTGRLNSAQHVLRSHLRFRTPPPPPSSTNEAALGPFNPRYTKTRTQQNNYRPPPASSHYFY